MYLKWGTVEERKGGMGREKRGGGKYTSNLGPGWTGIAPHAKEGFQVSKRESGTGEGFLGKGELPRGLCHVPPIQCQLCTYRVNCVYVC
jgi:hypothetical protein